MKFFFLTIFALFLSFKLWAFGNLTSTLQKIIEDQGYNKYFTTVSLLFENKNISNQAINIIELKKTIALELQKNFQVTDPIFSTEFAKNKSLNKDSFLQKEKVAQFFELTNSKILIFTDITESKQRIFTFHSIFSKDGEMLGSINQSFQKDPFLLTNTINQPKDVDLIKKNENEEPLFASASVEYFSQNDLNDFETNNFDINDFFSPTNSAVLRENTNWIFYQPTAIILTGQFLQINFDLNDIGLVQAVLNNFSYIAATENFEFSLHGTGYREELDYSYIRIKTKFYQQRTVDPLFALSGGLRKRLYRNDAAMQDELSNQREHLSFFLVASGYLGQINSMYSLYFDNYFFGAGYKVFLPQKINLFFDINQDYQSERKASYFAAGLEHSSTENIGYTVGFTSVSKKSVSENIKEEEDTSIKFNIGTKISW